MSTTEPHNNHHSFKSRSILGTAITPGVARWFVKTGITKNERSAGTLITFLIMLFFAISIYFFFFFK